MSEENKSPLSKEERKAQRQVKLAAMTPEERAKVDAKRAKKKEVKKAKRSGQTSGDQAGG